MILVDPRQGSDKLIQPLHLRVGEVQRYTLNSGDVAFDGNGPDGPVTVGIEYKALRDILACLRNDRYTGLQLPRMQADYDVVYLLIEGRWQVDERGILAVCSRDGKSMTPLLVGSKEQIRAGKGAMFQYSELDKQLCNLEAVRNVAVLRSGNQLETVNMIVNRYQWWRKPWEDHHSTDAIKFQANQHLGRVSWLRRVACELPGIGWTKSKAVEQHFGTIERMVNALPSEWAQIEGIGETLSVRLYGLLRGRMDK